jgi:KDO2-lipid IV(A) lauroyltransferase
VTVPSARGRLTTLAYRAGSRVAQIVPGSIATPAGGLIGRAAAPLLPAQRAMAARHQARACSGANGANRSADPSSVKGVFESYGRYWVEMLRLPRDVRTGAIPKLGRIEGFHHVTDGLAAGKGVILALPHLGGWEWAGAWLADQGYDFLAVVEQIEPPELLEWFAAQRAALGMEVVALGPDVSTTVLRALRANRAVCLLSDRDIQGDGVEVEFFGERTTLPAGPATLALRTGATLLPVAVYFRPGRDHLGVVRPPIPVEREGRLRDDIARITQALAHELELLIRAAPEQWHLLQPNWPSDRDASTRR